MFHIDFDAFSETLIVTILTKTKLYINLPRLRTELKEKNCGIYFNCSKILKVPRLNM